MKKYILWLFILLLFPISSKAVEKTQFILEKGNIEDDMIELNLVIQNNPQFCYFSLEIIFDQENLEYVSSNVIGLEKAMMKGIEKNLDGNIVVYALTLPESKLIDSTGKIATIKWKQKEQKDEKFQIRVNEYAANEEEELPYEVKELVVKKGTTSSKPILVNDKISLKEGLSEEVKDKKITWISSDEKIATIDEEGNVTFLKEGKVTIEGKADNKTIYQKEYQIEKESKEQKKDTNKNKNQKTNKNYSIVVIPIMILLIVIVLVFVKFKKSKVKS